MSRAAQMLRLCVIVLAMSAWLAKGGGLLGCLNCCDDPAPAPAVMEMAGDHGGHGGHGGHGAQMDHGADGGHDHGAADDHGGPCDHDCCDACPATGVALTAEATVILPVGAAQRAPAPQQTAGILTAHYLWPGAPPHGPPAFSKA